MKPVEHLMIYGNGMVFPGCGFQEPQLPNHLVVAFQKKNISYFDTSYPRKLYYPRSTQCLHVSC